MNVFRFGTIAIVSMMSILPVLPVRANSLATVNLHHKQQSQQVYFLLNRCQPALAERIGSRILISLDTLQDYFISNAENGLSGQGNLDASGNFRQFTFDCRVNIRDGRVTGVTTSFINDNPPVPQAPQGNGFTAIVDTPNGQPIVLRYGPGTEYFEIERVANGRSITLNGQSNGDWAQTASGAWVYRPYLRIVP